MNSLSTFKPLQPLHPDAAGSAMKYNEYRPCKALKEYIVCFWELRAFSAPAKEQELSYSIVADGCTDIIIPCHHQEDILLSVSGNKADRFSFGHSIHYFGIRFFPAAIHYFFKTSLRQLSSLTVPFSDVANADLAEVYDKLLHAASVEVRLQLLEEFLISRLAQSNATIDSRFLQSMHHILSSGGNAAIHSQVAEYISPRQQRRMFELYVGLSPKDFSRIVRFQNALSALIKIPPAQRRSAFYEFGYYDQSHFIRDFSQMYGDTPKNLFFLEGD